MRFSWSIHLINILSFQNNTECTVVFYVFNSIYILFTNFVYFREMLIDIIFDELDTIGRKEFIIRIKKYSSVEEDNDETLHQVR